MGALQRKRGTLKLGRPLLLFLVGLSPFLFTDGFVVQATPLMYDEAVDGDLPSGIVLTPLELGVGLNRITGTFRIDPTANDPPLPPPNLSGLDADGITFRVPPGEMLRRIEFATTSSNGILDTAWDLSRVFLDIPGVPRDFLGFGPDITIPTNGFIDLSFGSAPPLSSGDYFIHQSSISSTGIVASADYTFRFLVTPVPEPDTIVLVAIGLTGILVRFAMLRRRQHDSSD